MALRREVSVVKIEMVFFSLECDCGKKYGFSVDDVETVEQANAFIARRVGPRMGWRKSAKSHEWICVDCAAKEAAS